MRSVPPGGGGWGGVRHVREVRRLRDRRNRVLVPLAVATALLYLAEGMLLAPLRPSFLQLQLADTPTAFWAVAQEWVAARTMMRYVWHLPLDVAMLCCYGAFGWILGTRSDVFAPLGAFAQRVAPWILPVAAASDALENLLHLLLTDPGRGWPVVLYPLAATTSLVKFAGLATFGALTLAGWGLTLRARRRAERHAKARAQRVREDEARDYRIHTPR